MDDQYVPYAVCIYAAASMQLLFPDNVHSPTSGCSSSLWLRLCRHSDEMPAALASRRRLFLSCKSGLEAALKRVFGQSGRVHEKVISQTGRRASRRYKRRRLRLKMRFVTTLTVTKR